MRHVLFLALALTTSVSAYAQQAPALAEVIHYSYGTPLDIAKVTHITSAADVCAPTPVQMTYTDSAGSAHVLEYFVMGGGCTN